MPYAINQGIRIHYQVEGEGPPLVLQHGLFWSMKGWSRVGYVDALRTNYRLILIDARGVTVRAINLMMLPLVRCPNTSEISSRCLMRLTSLRHIIGAIHWAGGSDLGWPNTRRHGSIR